MLDRATWWSVAIGAVVLVAASGVWFSLATDAPRASQDRGGSTCRGADDKPYTEGAVARFGTITQVCRAGDWKVVSRSSAHSPVEQEQTTSKPSALPNRGGSAQSSEKSALVQTRPSTVPTQSSDTVNHSSRSCRDDDGNLYSASALRLHNSKREQCINGGWRPVK